MKKNVLTGLSRRHGPVCCKACGEAVEIGQKVVSKQNTRNNTKVFHKDCYEGLFLDV